MELHSKPVCRSSDEAETSSTFLLLPPDVSHTSSLSVAQVNTLGADVERLQQTYPQNASQIHLKKDELVTNWEQIGTLAAERHARLNDSYQ